MVVGRGSAATVGNHCVSHPSVWLKSSGTPQEKREVPPERKTGILFEEQTVVLTKINKLIFN
jgi:hypothetical protein